MEAIGKTGERRDERVGLPWQHDLHFRKFFDWPVVKRCTRNKKFPANLKAAFTAILKLKCVVLLNGFVIAAEKDFIMSHCPREGQCDACIAYAWPYPPARKGKQRRERLRKPGTNRVM